VKNRHPHQELCRFLVLAGKDVVADLVANRYSDLR
jgi:hypothetical protein